MSIKEIGKKAGKKISEKSEKLKRVLRKCVVDQKGEGFVDVLVKMLVVVVIGAALLAIMRVAVPSLFDDMMTKIRSVFEL